MEMVRTTVFLPRKLHKAMKALAFRKGTSMAGLMKKAVETTYFKNPGGNSALSLWGCLPNTNVTEKEIHALKTLWRPRV